MWDIYIKINLPNKTHYFQNMNYIGMYTRYHWFLLPIAIIWYVDRMKYSRLILLGYLTIIPIYAIWTQPKERNETERTERTLGHMSERGTNQQSH